MLKKRIISLIDFIKRSHTRIAISGLNKKPGTNPEIVRLVGLINVFGLVGLVYIVFMLVLTFVTGQYFHTIILTGFTVCSTVLLIILRVSGNHKVTGYGYMILMILLCIYLTITGGVDNNGHLWTFMFPPLFLYMYGFRKGITGILISISIMGFILFFRNGELLFTEYLVTFKSRYLLALSGVTLISCAAEYSRRKTHAEVMYLNEHLLETTEKLKEAARTDTLTGLSNRRDLYEKIEYEQIKLNRHPDCYSIIIADIDHFKKINDTYGHDCGDEVLKKIASIIRENTRKEDTACRWGGEEFFLLLPSTGQAGCLAAAEKLRDKIEKTVFKYKEIELNLTVSIGIETCCAEKDVDDYIKLADRKLYIAKQQGRNRVVSDLDNQLKDII